MNNLNKITINKIEYILGEDIKKIAPVWWNNARNPRDFIKKKEIDEENYKYAKMINNDDDKWIITDGRATKTDKVIIKVDYLKTCDTFMKEIDGEKVKNEKGREKIPDILELEDHEKFQDDEGNPCEIETRGERTPYGIYFKVKDVSECFAIESLYNILVNSNTTYTENDDYKYFTCEKIKIVNKKTGKQTSKKTDNDNTEGNAVTKDELYLTYCGILRMLFITRNGKTNKFFKWATESLFTMQMGTPEQKKELASKIMGVSIGVLSDVLKTSMNNISCIYLFTLGTVKELRKYMNIDVKFTDDMIICKYGNTNDLHRRTGEHRTTLGKIKNADLKLKYYSYVDTQLIVKAENDLKQYMLPLNAGLEYQQYAELIVLDEKQLKDMSDQYKKIGKLFGGQMTESINRIKELEKDQEIMKNKYEAIIEKLNTEIETLKIMHKKEMEIKDLLYKNEKIKHENEMEIKDLLYKNEKIKHENEIEIKDLLYKNEKTKHENEKVELMNKNKELANEFAQYKQAQEIESLKNQLKQTNKICVKNKTKKIK